eukprot:CAMPEP_0194209416 /NCGR_PEP_ID=MMETSP0156-20130528/7550_1 /TAXON_ID=33649 /ORGANISM="Thalassionema nitzschioides, Strain L26-B" /LENGTH=586 /DNA_ID=CAMNT_0038936585 /DNA_START=39 /DNA_END=1796 /DNA_ORIENTATION=-
MSVSLRIQQRLLLLPILLVGFLPIICLHQYVILPKASDFFHESSSSWSSPDLRSAGSTSTKSLDKDYIPSAILEAAETDEAMRVRIGRIRRWHSLEQHSIVDRMIQKSMDELTERTKGGSELTNSGTDKSKSRFSQRRKTSNNMETPNYFLNRSETEKRLKSSHGTNTSTAETKEKDQINDNQKILEGGPKSKVESYRELKTVRGMSACLFIMDDIIRLIEWLAYHYTVLPLEDLMVAIDPHSNHPDQIVSILDQWSPYMNITILRNDSIYLSEVPFDKAWKRKYYLNGKFNPFHRKENRDSTEYASQEHKRRQNIFTAYCHRNFHLQGKDWNINLDTDEFLLFNYLDNNEQVHSSNFVKEYIKPNATLAHDRRNARDIREILPSLSNRITVAEVLQQTNFDRCLRLPALNFTGHLSHLQSSANSSADLLLTMRQFRTGPKEGRTTKALLDLSRAQTAYLTWKQVVNAHNPNKRMCGWNGVIGSGTDYISSVFRYHHYVAGSIETHLQRVQDYRRRTDTNNSLLQNFQYRNNFTIIRECNKDILPWLPWFLDKIESRKEANRLLFHPLQEEYKKMQASLPQLVDME